MHLYLSGVSGCPAMDVSFILLTDWCHAVHLLLEYQVPLQLTAGT